MTKTNDEGRLRTIISEQQFTPGAEGRRLLDEYSTAQRQAIYEEVIEMVEAEYKNYDNWSTVDDGKYIITKLRNKINE